MAHPQRQGAEPIGGRPRSVQLATPTAGRWLVDGAPAPALDGCLDVDLESSALTDCFPVRRLGLAPGEQADAPAAYVRALDQGVERLEQTYRRVEGHDVAFEYQAPAFGFSCRLTYDQAGMILVYPGIASRAA